MFQNVDNVALLRLYSTGFRGRHSPFQHCYVSKNQLYHHNHTISSSKYLVVVTTFLTAPSLRGKNFTHILMDEGSQSREPEAIAPLCLADSSTKLVIAGDSHQV